MADSIAALSHAAQWFLILLSALAIPLPPPGARSLVGDADEHPEWW